MIGPIVSAEWPDRRRETAVTIEFDGRVAIVTGAGGGLGKTYALELGRRGAKVVVNDLGGNPDGTGAAASPADATVAEITAAGGEAGASYDSVAPPEGGAGVPQPAPGPSGAAGIALTNPRVLAAKPVAHLACAAPPAG